MSKPIWELEPDELDQALAQPNPRTPRVSDAARLHAGLAQLAQHAASNEAGEHDAASEFDEGSDTQSSPNEWKDQLEEPVACAEPPHRGPAAAPARAGEGAAFSPPTAQISRDQLEALRSELMRNSKK